MKLNKIAVLSGAVALSMSMGAVADRDDYGHDHGKKGGFSFAIIADGPYGADQEPKYDNLIDDINSDHSVRFVIHAGDIKAGGEMCTDELLTRRFKQLQQIRKALVYTPGDNEWTDCHRASNGSYLPTERLEFIRNLFFPHPDWTTGGRAMRVKSQSEITGYEQFVENTLFSRKGVVFSQIHVVGSNNNLRPWDQLPGGDLPGERLAEFTKRNEASVVWLKHTFEVAEQRNAPGVFITIHADPNFDVDRTDDNNRAGFNDFLDALSAEALRFGKPVVLAHGDSHFYRVDMPRLVPWYRTGDATTAANNVKISNLTRMETFGHFDNHWVKVVVDPSDKMVFRFIPQVVEPNL